MSHRSFLEVDPKPKSILNMLEEPDFPDFDMDLGPSEFKNITPTPGFCVKVKTDNNEKLFVNICHSSDIPPPPESLDVYKIIAGEGNSDEEALFHFPLSLGEPHIELDHSGKEVKCYDVVLNSGYFQEVSKKNALRDFIMTLACSGLERKYDISIDIGTCHLLSKPYHGSKIPAHYIKLNNLTYPDKKKPDYDNDDVVMPVKNPSQLLVASSSSRTSRFSMFQCPEIGQPSFLIFQGFPQGVKDSKSVRVFVSKRKLTVKHPKGKVLSEVFLPFHVAPEKSLSNFSKGRLVIIMPVESPPAI